MADTLKCLAAGTLTASSATLYTAGSSTTVIVKEIILCNKTSSAATATMTFAGTNVIYAKSIAVDDTLVIELHSILSASAVIAGLASAASAIDYYISGIEVS
jgi:hypothetical protein